MKSSTDEDLIQFLIPHGAYEIESLNNEIKRIIIDNGHYTEAIYPFTIRPNFSTSGSIVEISKQGVINGFVFNDIIGNLLGFNETILWKCYKLSPNPVGILSFDIIFLECDITRGMIFKGRRSGIRHNFTMNVDPGYKYIGKFRGGVQWFMMESKDLISGINFEKKKRKC